MLYPTCTDAVLSPQCDQTTSYLGLVRLATYVGLPVIVLLGLTIMTHTLSVKCHQWSREQVKANHPEFCVNNAVEDHLEYMKMRKLMAKRGNQTAGGAGAGGGMGGGTAGGGAGGGGAGGEDGGFASPGGGAQYDGGYGAEEMGGALGIGGGPSRSPSRSPGAPVRMPAPEFDHGPHSALASSYLPPVGGAGAGCTQAPPDYTSNITPSSRAAGGGPPSRSPPGASATPHSASGRPQAATTGMYRGAQQITHY